MKTLNKYIYILSIKNNINIIFDINTNKIHVMQSKEEGIMIIADFKKNINFFEQLSFNPNDYKMINVLNPSINIYKKMFNTLKLLNIIHS